MHGLMSYQRFGRTRSLRSDRVSTRARSLRSDRAEHVFGRCVAILFELLSDDSRFLRKAFRKEESILKKSLRSEWKQAKKSPTCFRRKISTETPIETKRKLRLRRNSDRSLRSDRAGLELDRYVGTELCNQFAALPFSAINLGVFCGFWENKFYPSEKFSENVFWHYGVCVIVGHMRSGGWGCLTSVVANCDFVFRVFRHCFDQAFCG
ncbi:hypothetical protein F2Q69_00022363 [Brassica cretica]|uniref:Uncharacterized protein n=1 Tax=Brassica cretica TaxID=69181 RepID=A0A8S9QGF7_BRACR|nr:hypothetical protein F2Q69_00022363 [Brassica cretica]